MLTLLVEILTLVILLSGSKEELVIVGSRDVIDSPGLWLGPVGDVGCSRGEVGGEGGSWRANAIGDGQPSLASTL